MARVNVVRTNKASTISIPAPKTSAYTIQSGDEDKLIQLSGSSSYAVSIPTDATFNFAIGTQITFLNISSSFKAITASNSNITIVSSTPGPNFRARWSSATIIKLSANNWVILGDLTA
jgi:hypothetical protein